MKQSLRGLRTGVEQGTPLTWLTCYDYSFARALNETDLDLILVGDSGGMVSLGYTDTVPVSMEEMLMLTSAVRRGAPDKFVVGDMPKGSYEVSDELAVINAMRFAKEAGADAVKLEGGLSMTDRIAAITKGGITVFGHVGLTPQSTTALGGYRVMGRDDEEAQDILADAIAVEEAGAAAILLEALPPSVAQKVSSTLNIPVFGIGAGPFVHGQLLILHDLLGLYPDFRPKFAKCFVPSILEDFVVANRDSSNSTPPRREGPRQDGFFELAKRAAQSYVDDVRAGIFPDDTYSYSE